MSLTLSDTSSERATWIATSYFSSIDAAAMAEFADIGINRLYVDVWNNGKVYFQSETMSNTVSNDGGYGGDELSEIISLASTYPSIEIHAWFEYGLMACYGDDTSAVPFCDVADQNGWILGYDNWQYMDPANTDVLDFLIGIMSDLVNNYPDVVGIQLDDHFGCPVDLDCTSSDMTSAARYVWDAMESVLSSTQIFSLTPAAEGWALDNYNVDWKSWIETYNIFNDEVIPQLYRTSYSSFKSELDDHIDELASSTLAIMAVGVRDDGTGDSTDWDELENMIDYTYGKGYGVVIWYAKGILETHTSEYETKWGGSGTSGTDCTPQTAGGVSVAFASATLISVESCDDNYDDPNDMGVFLFSEDDSGAYTYLSNNFQVYEFVSGDGADLFRLSPLIVNCVQEVRDELAEAVYIGDAYKTVSYNEETNGASSSRHLSGTAATVSASTADVMDVADAIICNCWEDFSESGYSIGLGLGDTFIHVDVREEYGYWVEDSGSDYTSEEWNEYISAKYRSCVSTSNTNSDDEITTATDTNGDDTVDGLNSDGTVSFPNVDLTPLDESDISDKYEDPNDSGTYLFSESLAGKSTYLSNNFQVSEFVCDDGSDGFRLSPKLVECVQAVREDLGTAVGIATGYRTTTYNSQVGGATYSRHQSGTAADVFVYDTNVDILTLADSVICECRSLFISYGEDIGLGLGTDYIHVDMRPYYAYWVDSDDDVVYTSSEWDSYIVTSYLSCPLAVDLEEVISYINGTIILTDSTTSENDLHEGDNDIDDNEDVNVDRGGNDSKNKRWSWILIFAVTIGIILVLALISGFVYYCYKMKKAVNKSDEMDGHYVQFEEVNNEYNYANQ